MYLFMTLFSRLLLHNAKNFVFFFPKRIRALQTVNINLKLEGNKIICPEKSDPMMAGRPEYEFI